jgi:hypothetical protein
VFAVVRAGWCTTGVNEPREAPSYSAVQAAQGGGEVWVGSSSGATWPRATRNRSGPSTNSTGRAARQLTSINFDVAFKVVKLNSVIFVYRRVGELEFVPVISQIVLNHRIGLAPGEAAIYDHHFNSLRVGVIDLPPENWSSYYESPTAHNGLKEDSLWANDTHRSRSSASCARRRRG